jgi:hypothetical protein
MSEAKQTNRSIVMPRLLSELQQIQKALTPFRNQAPDTRTWRSPKLRDHLYRAGTLRNRAAGLKLRKLK